MLLLLLFCAYTSAQYLDSPCPDFFHYQPRDDSTDRWYGLMNLESNEDVTGFQLKLTLNNAALALVNLFGQTITYDYKEYIITNRNFRLKPNISHLIRLYVKYDPTKPIPALVKIEQNEKIICEETYNPPLQIFTSVFVNPNQSAIVPNPAELNVVNEIKCGTIAAQAVPLIAGGVIAEVGRYPWHVALYTKSDVYDDDTFRYGCGGNLVSKQHIVTAAHCIVRTRAIQAHLGKHKLSDNQTSRVQILEVSESVIHPDYSLIKHSNDIAVLKLKTSAVFNDFVRPVCLWEEDTNYENIIGKAGTVVGWGFNEAFEVQDSLNVIKMSPVSYQDCLKKDPIFYITRNTYCAGALNGTACQGDTGGGMIFPKENSDREVYQLRGIVSQGRYCSGDHYVVFVDVATYLDFIKANME